MGVLPDEDIKRLPVELNVRAARKRQSPQTGFVHHCYEAEDERHDTIPLFENFCFVLALLRTKTSENMTEGLELLQRLLAFEKEGHFPVYLHEYPYCKDRMLASRLLPLLTLIATEFRPILDSALQDTLHELTQRICPQKEQTSEIASQAWHPHLCTYIGVQEQEKGEPKPTLFDFFMCDYHKTYPARLLADHPIHLRTALVYPLERKDLCLDTKIPAQAITTAHARQPYALYWGSTAHLHSLVCAPKRAACDIVALEQGALFTFTLDPSLFQDPSQEDLIEIAFFCDLHPAHTLLVANQKASTFQLHEALEIRSAPHSIRIAFSLLEGEGTFFGHLSRANRPLQIAARGSARHEAYDWQIGLRTVRRTTRCVIRACLQYYEQLTSVEA